MKLHKSFYLSQSAQQSLDTIYINRIANQNKASYSSLIEEAITLLEKEAHVRSTQGDNLHTPR